MDLSWEVFVGNMWHKFALLEFKRPGSVKIATDFQPAMNGGTVMGDGEKICRQIVKYSYTWGLNFVSVCDGICLILGILRGERAQYYNAQTIPRPVSAQCSFCDSSREYEADFVYLGQISVEILFTREWVYGTRYSINEIEFIMLLITSKWSLYKGVLSPCSVQVLLQYNHSCALCLLVTTAPSNILTVEGYLSHC